MPYRAKLFPTEDLIEMAYMNLGETLNEIDGDDTYLIIDETLVSHNKWGSLNRMVFKKLKENSYWTFTYEMEHCGGGVLEDAGEYTFCTEVTPVEVMKVEYLPKEYEDGCH